MNSVKTLLKCMMLASLGMPATVFASSVPEPSNIVHGVLYVTGPEGSPEKEVVVQKEGLRIYAMKGQTVVSETELKGDGTYLLEIPVEVTVGQASADVARVDDLVRIFVGADTVPASSFTVANRGVVIERKLYTSTPIDTDGDGIPDFDDPAPTNPGIPIAFGGSADIDGDGISNAREFYLRNTTANEDYEYDPFGDYDQDGFTNNDEYRLSSNPANGDSFPENHIAQKDFMPVGISNDMSVLRTTVATDFEVLPEWGEVRDISLIHWSLNGTPEIAIAADQIHIIGTDSDFNVAPGQDLAFTMTGLPELSSLSDYRIGYDDFDGNGILEFWVHTSEDKLYVYKREALPKPFGTGAPWQILDGVMYTQATSVADITGDGIADIVYISPVQAGETGYQANGETTLRARAGVWDGRQYFLNSEYRATNAALPQNIDDLFFSANIKEVGFDATSDLIASGDSWSYTVLPSAFTYTTSTLPLYSVYNGNLTSFDDLNSESAISLPSSEHNGVLAYDLNNDGLSDQLRLINVNSKRKIAIHYGEEFSGDNDNDGILNHVDIDPDNSNVPLPHGDSNFDADNSPYGSDPDTSGQRDSDNDGIKDEFEVRYGLSLSSDDSELDTDNDGFTNIQEYLNGTNPVVADTPSGQKLSLLKQRQIFESGSVSSIVVQDQTLFVSSFNSPVVQILNLVTLEKIGEMNNQFSETENLAGINVMLIHGNRLFAGGANGTVAVWDAQTQSLITKDIKDADSGITSMDIHAGVLYASDAAGDVHRWNSESYSYLGKRDISSDDSALSYVQATDDYVITQITQGIKEITLWNSDNSVYYSINGGTVDDMKLAVTSGTDEMLALAQHFGAGGIYLMNIEDSTNRLISGSDNPAIVSSLKLTAENLFSGYRDGNVRQIPLSNESLQISQNTDGTAVKAMEVTTRNLITGHSSGKVFVWSIAHDL